MGSDCAPQNRRTRGNHKQGVLVLDIRVGRSELLRPLLEIPAVPEREQYAGHPSSLRSTEDESGVLRSNGGDRASTCPFVPELIGEDVVAEEDFEVSCNLGAEVASGRTTTASNTYSTRVSAASTGAKMA